MEINIAVVNDEDLYLLIKSLMQGTNILYYECKTEEQEENFYEDISDDGISIIIIDRTIYNLKSALKRIRATGIKTIMCDHATDYKILKESLKDNLIVDYFEKSEYKNLLEIIEKQKSIKIGYADKIFVKDGSNGIIIKRGDIIKVYYERETKKSIIYTATREVKVRKYLQDVEDLLSNFPEFIRADRGTIVNTARIMEMGEEQIVFDDGSKEFFNRQVIKTVKEYIVGNTAIEIWWKEETIWKNQMVSFVF